MTPCFFFCRVQLFIIFFAFYELAKLYAQDAKPHLSCYCHFLFVTYRRHVIFLFQGSPLPRGFLVFKMVSVSAPPGEGRRGTQSIFGWAAEGLKPDPV